MKAYFPGTEILLRDEVEYVTSITDNFGVFDSGMTGFISRMTPDSDGDLGVMGMYWSNENISTQLTHHVRHHILSKSIIDQGAKFHDSVWIWPRITLDKLVRGNLSEDEFAATVIHQNEYDVSLPMESVLEMLGKSNNLADLSILKQDFLSD